MYFSYTNATDSMGAYNLPAGYPDVINAQANLLDNGVGVSDAAITMVVTKDGATQSTTTMTESTSNPGEYWGIGSMQHHSGSNPANVHVTFFAVKGADQATGTFDFTVAGNTGTTNTVTKFSSAGVSNSAITELNGNVGIGDANPADILSVAKMAADVAFRFTNLTPGARAWLMDSLSDGRFDIFNLTESGAYISFRKSSHDALLNPENFGKVGIGTYSPAAKLDIAGNIAVNGTEVVSSGKVVKGDVAGCLCRNFNQSTKPGLNVHEYAFWYNPSTGQGGMLYNDGVNYWWFRAASGYPVEAQIV